MDIVLDTSSIINLINGSVFDRVLTMNGYRFFIGDQLFNKEVLDEVQKIIVEALIAKNKIVLLKSAVTASIIAELRVKYRLGLGETECMALCKICNKAICTDDFKARRFSVIELGESQVFGSLSLLKESVNIGTLSCLEVLTSYMLMIEKGAFLPKGLTDDYFCH
ncbi:MAG TPA: hypothetical protein VGN20_15280 [Mucilaginibacter sp.]|jgi:hypothetical protein